MLEKLKNMFRSSREAQPYDNVELARELTQQSIDEMYSYRKESIESNIRYAINCGHFTTCDYVSDKNHQELLKKDFESRGFKVSLQGNAINISWK